MSDIFAGLNGGIKLPDVQMNVGPLPNTSGGPVGSDGTADGRYNFNSDLLSGIEPYAFGSSARMGSDRNYQQIPHRVQKIIPLLYLPYADDNVNDCLMPISHAVDQGDIAFVINSERTLSLLYDKNAMHDPSIYLRQTPAWSAFCNIVTVNYILAGLQRIPADGSKKKGAWALLANDLCYDWKKNNTPGKFDELLKLMQTRLIPFGICAGSENQGGLHETGLAPVQAAANHVTTMTVDGQNRDLVNYWSVHDLSAGDQLIMRLEFLPTSEYTLNHYYKQMATQRFNSKDSNDINCWQLVADRYSISYDPCLDLSQRYPVIEDKLTPCYDYRLDGYWRIGQLFQHRGKQNSSVKNFSDDMVFLKGQLLQITFAPVWLRMCEHGSRNGVYGSRGVKGGGDASKYKTDKSSGGRFYGHGKPGKRGAADMFDNACEDRLMGYSHNKQHKQHRQHKQQRQGGSFFGDDDFDTDSDNSDWDGGGGGGGGGGGYGGGDGEGGYLGGGDGRYEKSEPTTVYVSVKDYQQRVLDMKQEVGNLQQQGVNIGLYREVDPFKWDKEYAMMQLVKRKFELAKVNFKSFYIRDSARDDFNLNFEYRKYNEASQVVTHFFLSGEKIGKQTDELFQEFFNLVNATEMRKDPVVSKWFEWIDLCTEKQREYYGQFYLVDQTDLSEHEVSEIDLCEARISKMKNVLSGMILDPGNAFKDVTLEQLRSAGISAVEDYIREQMRTPGALSSDLTQDSASNFRKKLLTLVGDKDKHTVQANDSKDSAEPATKKVKVVKKMIKAKGDVEMKLGGNATDDTTTK